MNRWLTRVLLTIGIIVASATAAVPSAAADYYVGTNLIRNWETGLCLRNSAHIVYTVGCNFDDAYEIWEPLLLGHADYDVVFLQNRGSGECLRTDRDNIGQQFLTSGTCPSRESYWPSYFMWSVQGSWTVARFVVSDGHRCLDSNYQGYAYVLSCNGGGYQAWRFGY